MVLVPLSANWAELSWGLVSGPALNQPFVPRHGLDCKGRNCFHLLSLLHGKTWSIPKDSRTKAEVDDRM